MPIPIRSWTGLQAAAESVGLVVYEKPNSCEFFVHIQPSVAFSQADLRSNYHLHVFLESNIDAVAEGATVAIRISTVLPKTAFAGGGARPNLADVATGNWQTTVQNMDPTNAATELAAQLFAAAVRSQATVHAGNLGKFKQM